MSEEIFETYIPVAEMKENELLIVKKVFDLGAPNSMWLSTKVSASIMRYLMPESGVKEVSVQLPCICAIWLNFEYGVNNQRRTNGQALYSIYQPNVARFWSKDLNEQV